jgi:hypothetical protein
MLRWIILVLAIVGVSAAVPFIVSMQPGEAKGGGVRHPVSEAVNQGTTGKAYIDGKTLHEFGHMAQFAKGKHEFVVKNVGEATLELRPGSSTCQCTVANFEQNKKALELEPGGSTTITVTWDTKETSGNFEKMVSIQTSDPAQPEIWFTVKGKVSPAIITVPPDLTLNFLNIENDRAETARVAMSSLDRPDFKILRLTSTRPELFVPTSRELTSEEKVELGFASGHRVDIEIKPSSEVGTFAEEVVVITDHPDRQEVRIPVRGKRIGAISAAPESLRIEADSSSGGSRSAVLFVRGQESTRFEVAEKPEGLEVKIDPIEGAGSDVKVKRYRMTLAIPPGTPPSVIKGQVVLKTDHPSVEKLQLPVSAVVLGSR